jgi:hypothetical protein
VIVTNNGIYAVPYLAACCEVVDFLLVIAPVKATLGSFSTEGIS